MEKEMKELVEKHKVYSKIIEKLELLEAFEQLFIPDMKIQFYSCEDGLEYVSLNIKGTDFENEYDEGAFKYELVKRLYDYYFAESKK